MRVSGDNPTGSFTQGLCRACQPLAPAHRCRAGCMRAERRVPPPQKAIPESRGLWWVPCHNRICHSEVANSPFFVYRPDGHYQSQKAGQKPWLSHPALSRDLIAVSCCSEVLCSSDFIIITKQALELHPKQLKNSDKENEPSASCDIANWLSPASQSSLGLLIPQAPELTMGSSVLKRITQVWLWFLLCNGAKGWVGWVPASLSRRTSVRFPL